MNHAVYFTIHTCKEKARNQCELLSPNTFLTALRLRSCYHRAFQEMITRTTTGIVWDFLISMLHKFLRIVPSNAERPQSSLIISGEPCTRPDGASIFTGAHQSESDNSPSSRTRAGSSCGLLPSRTLSCSPAFPMTTTLLRATPGAVLVGFLVNVFPAGRRTLPLPTPRELLGLRAGECCLREVLECPKPLSPSHGLLGCLSGECRLLEIPNCCGGDAECVKPKSLSYPSYGLLGRLPGECCLLEAPNGCGGGDECAKPVLLSYGLPGRLPGECCLWEIPNCRGGDGECAKPTSPSQGLLGRLPGECCLLEILNCRGGGDDCARSVPLSYGLLGRLPGECSLWELPAILGAEPGCIKPSSSQYGLLGLRPGEPNLWEVLESRGGDGRCPKPLPSRHGLPGLRPGETSL